MGSIRHIITSLVLIGMIGGCSIPIKQEPASPAPPPTPPETPPTTAPQPVPPPPRKPVSKNYSVPPNTRDPVLVQRGVNEWLWQHPDYAGVRRVAVLHRMYKESGYRPCAHNGPQHALLQWRGSRLRHLYAFTHVRPGDCPSWLAQLEFMNAEIRQNRRYAKFLMHQPRNERDAYLVFTKDYLIGRP